MGASGTVLRLRLERRVGELSHAFNERPVTLITAIYHIAERASPLNCPPLR
jgi:hypothetical protein